MSVFSNSTSISVMSWCTSGGCCCCCRYAELTYGQAHTVELINTPVFVDDMKSYTTYDQRSIDDVDDYKPPYNVRTPSCISPHAP